MKGINHTFSRRAFLLDVFSGVWCWWVPTRGTCRRDESPRSCSLDVRVIDGVSVGPLPLPCPLINPSVQPTAGFAATPDLGVAVLLPGLNCDTRVRLSLFKELGQNRARHTPPPCADVSCSWGSPGAAPPSVPEEPASPQSLRRHAASCTAACLSSTASTRFCSVLFDPVGAWSLKPVPQIPRDDPKLLSVTEPPLRTGGGGGRPLPPQGDRAHATALAQGREGLLTWRLAF